MDIVTLDKIRPFIRYAQDTTIYDDTVFGTSVAYDNRIFLCIGGHGNIIVNNECYPMHYGSLLMWMSNLHYRYESDINSPLRLIGFNFDFNKKREMDIVAIPPAKPEAFIPSNVTEHIRFGDIEAFNTPFYISEISSLKKLFQEIKNEFTQKKYCCMERSCALFTDLLAQLARASVLDTPRNSKVDEIITYIQENFNTDLHNDTLAEVFGYHPGYIGALIKKATGTSIRQYLINYRIERAIDMLQSGNANVTEACYLCGFSDLAHFSKCFKNKTGRSPSEYIH